MISQLSESSTPHNKVIKPKLSGIKNIQQDDWGSDFEETSLSPELQRKSSSPNQPFKVDKNEFHSENRLNLKPKSPKIGPKPAISPKPRAKYQGLIREKVKLLSAQFVLSMFCCFVS